MDIQIATRSLGIRICAWPQQSASDVLTIQYEHSDDCQCAWGTRELVSIKGQRAHASDLVDFIGDLLASCNVVIATNFRVATTS